MDEATLARRALEDFGARLAAVYAQNRDASRKAAADSTQDVAAFWAPSDAVLEALFSQAAEKQAMTGARLREVVEADPELRRLQARVIQDVLLGQPPAGPDSLAPRESAGARQP